MFSRNPAESSQGERSEELDLRALIETSDDAIIRNSLDGTIVSWNKGAEKIYGYEAEEILEQPISVLIPPGQPNELPRIMKRLQRCQPIQSYETMHIHKDRHSIDVSVTISPVKDKAGKVVGASVVARDVTKQKQAEAALRLSEERLRVALKNAPVVVFTQDLQLRYTGITPPVMTWDHRNYIGYTDLELFGEQGARLMAIKQKVLRSGVGYHDEFSITFEGVTRYWDLVIEPFRDAKGMLVGLTSSAFDTKPLKDLIVKLQEALDEVEVLRGAAFHLCLMQKDQG